MIEIKIIFISYILKDNFYIEINNFVISRGNKLQIYKEYFKSYLASLVSVTFSLKNYAYVFRSEKY